MPCSSGIAGTSLSMKILSSPSWSTADYWIVMEPKQPEGGQARAEYRTQFLEPLGRHTSS